MSSHFERALAFVLEREGGYTNDLADHGGATNKGILQREYSAWLKRNRLPPRDVRHILDADLRAVYLEEYWEGGRCGALPWPLSAVHFDACVNVGPGQAAKFLQRAVGAQDDGVIGPRTLAKVFDATAGEGVFVVIQTVVELRHVFYKALAVNDATQVRFLKGWENRLGAVKKFVQEVVLEG